jgi:hypothetical protein
MLRCVPERILKVLCSGEDAVAKLKFDTIVPGPSVPNATTDARRFRRL